MWVQDQLEWPPLVVCGRLLGKTVRVYCFPPWQFHWPETHTRTVCLGTFWRARWFCLSSSSGVFLRPNIPPRNDIISRWKKDVGNIQSLVGCYELSLRAWLPYSLSRVLVSSRSLLLVSAVTSVMTVMWYDVILHVTRAQWLRSLYARTYYCEIKVIHTGCWCQTPAGYKKNMYACIETCS